MKKPNLFIVGNPKSGTTALHFFLEQHPDIFMSRPKEVHYFCMDFHELSDAFHGKKTKAFYEFRNLTDYLRLFSKARGKKAVGEASVGYLYSRVAAKEIYKFNPNAKIIIMLREPVSFLYSLHAQYVNETAENVEDFWEALAAEKDRLKGKNIPRRTRCPSYLYYHQRIKYAEQIGRYLEEFPKKHVKIIIFDDFKKDNAKVYQEVLDFLDVDMSFVHDFKKVHESKLPRFKSLNYVFRNPYLKNIPKCILPARFYDKVQLKFQAMLMKPARRKPIDPKLRKQLMKRFKPEVEELSKLLKRNIVNEWGYDNNA